MLEERSYRTYVTNSLMLAPQMKYISTKWCDAWGRIVSSEPERTADEIVDSVLSRLEG